MSMTLSDRLTRGTYLFDHGPGRPSVICLSYSWMGDALKLLPLTVDQRVGLMLASLQKVYPGLDLKKHIIGDPITVSWESDPNFLGAFKGALPGPLPLQPPHVLPLHAGRPAAARARHLPGRRRRRPGPRAGSRVRSPPASTPSGASSTTWAAAAIPENPGPGDRFAELAPVALPD